MSGRPLTIDQILRLRLISLFWRWIWVQPVFFGAYFFFNLARYFTSD